jgi:hypothetical protein
VLNYEWLMRACFKLWSVVAVGLAFLPASLRAEFVYVANAGKQQRLGLPHR